MLTSTTTIKQIYIYHNIYSKKLIQFSYIYHNIKNKSRPKPLPQRRAILPSKTGKSALTRAILPGKTARSLQANMAVLPGRIARVRALFSVLDGRIARVRTLFAVLIKKFLVYLVNLVTSLFYHHTIPTLYKFGNDHSFSIFSRINLYYNAFQKL